MFFLIGLVVVFGSVLGGYLPHGNPLVLWQPLEYLIIIGAAVGAYIIANPKPVLGATMKQLGRIFKGPPHNKESYLELLTLLYSIFKMIRSKGLLSVETHIENPEESQLFTNYPNFMGNTHAMEFLCDYLRLMTMGTDDPHIMEDLMDEEIETHHAETNKVSDAVINMGDGMPAFGIVAAVLGVIVTMSAITEPPEVLGRLVGAALVGTFLGVLLSYGLVGPVGKYLGAYAEAETKYYECIKVALLAHLKGCAPAVSVEFARKTLYSHDRPNFTEVEEAVESVLPV